MVEEDMLDTLRGRVSASSAMVADVQEDMNATELLNVEEKVKVTYLTHSSQYIY